MLGWSRATLLLYHCHFTTDNTSVLLYFVTCRHKGSKRRFVMQKKKWCIIPTNLGQRAGLSSSVRPGHPDVVYTNLLLIPYLIYFSSRPLLFSDAWAPRRRKRSVALCESTGYWSGSAGEACSGASRWARVWSSRWTLKALNIYMLMHFTTAKDLCN